MHGLLQLALLSNLWMRIQGILSFKFQVVLYYISVTSYVYKIFNILYPILHVCLFCPGREKKNCLEFLFFSPREVAGRLTSPRTLVMGLLNVRGCSSVESKRCEIGCMFGRRGMDVLALCETKMKGKGEVAFGEVTSRVSEVERGRAREVSGWEIKVVEWKEVSSRLMWVRVRMGREC